MDWLDPDFVGKAPQPDAKLQVDYDIEGSDVGYRWNARMRQRVLFPFGYGLSYTTFSSSDLAVDGMKASFTVRNTGEREGAYVAQLYMTAMPHGAQRRLVAFQRVQLKPGESRKVTVQLEPRIVAEYSTDGWLIAPGSYSFALGEDAEELGSPVTVRLKRQQWGP